MAALSIVVAAAALLGQPGEVDRWRPLVEAASARCGVPVGWIERVMHAESRGTTHMNGRPIRSVKGAIGLMQLMPGTWADMRRDLGLGDDPDAPGDNIVAGACYLRRMHDRFGYPGLFGAYNAGPARYARHLAGRPLPAETTAYMRIVAGTPDMPVTAAPRALPAIFVVRRDTPAASPVPDAVASSHPLFAILNDAR